MKIYIYGLLGIFILGCTSTKVINNPGNNNITGSWKLTNVDRPGVEMANETPLFDVALISCLEGSVWNFNDDKTSGIITMNGSNCEKKLIKIHWLIYEPGDGTVNFQFKYVTNNEESSINNTRGFQTKIDKMDGSTMVMQTKSGKDSNSTIMLTFNRVTP